MREQVLVHRSLSFIAIRYGRLALPAIVIAFMYDSVTRQIVISVLADAYIQVSIFVAGTLTLYYGLTQTFKQQKFQDWMGSSSFLATCTCAVLGALPGCGGAIIVITQFTKGKVSFGGVVAVLTATMGDAAFLLFAQKPLDGLIVMIIGVLTGGVTGALVNSLHKDSFMCPSRFQLKTSKNKIQSDINKSVEKVSLYFWKILLIPASIVAVLVAIQIDTDRLFILPEGFTHLFSAIAGFMVILLWSLTSKGSSYTQMTSEEGAKKHNNWLLKVALDTQFVTSWVVASFLLFELIVHFSGIDLVAWLGTLGSNVILASILIGFLPGCGPQILVTSMYIQGVLPFSAQLGNAISNDGDALFPAIALAPKAAFIATIYSAIPAFIIAFGYHFLFEVS